MYQNLPILNTTQGGTRAGVGTRDDSNSSHLVLAVPLIGNADDVHHIIKGSGSEKTFTNGNAAFQLFKVTSMVEVLFLMVMVII